jgi:hypothetical protein
MVALRATTKFHAGIRRQTLQINLAKKPITGPCSQKRAVKTFEKLFCTLRKKLKPFGFSKLIYCKHPCQRPEPVTLSQHRAQRKGSAGTRLR